MRKGQFLVLLTAIFALAFANATFARNYPLTVAGIRVTDTNCTNITGTGIVGSVSYNHATRTLTLNNATITHSQHIIEADSTLTVKLVGTNALQNISGLGDALYAKGDSLVIEGPEGSTLCSVVFCSGTNSRYGTHLIVRGGCTLYAYGHYGLTATGARTGEYLTIDKSTVIARGATDYSIGGFANVTLRETVISVPSRATYNINSRRLVDISGNVVNDTVMIEPKYPVRVGNTWITKRNCDSLVCPEVVSGLVRYTDSTKTLLLRKATIQISSGAPAYIYCDSNITIVFEDTNHLDNGQSVHGIRLNGERSVIKSTPNAFLSLSSYYSISSHNLTIQIQGYIEASGLIQSLYSQRDTLTVIRSHLKISQIYNYQVLILDECSLVYPIGSYYNTSAQRLVNPLPQSTSYFEIDATAVQPLILYPFWVDGVRVTSYNASNIMNSNTTTNLASYDPTTNTLEFRDININRSYGQCIRCDSSVNIIFQGTNNLTSRQTGTNRYPIIELLGSNTTISGSSSTIVNFFAQYANVIKTQYRLTISNINLFATGYGIARSNITLDSTLGNLYLNNTNIKILSDYNSGLYITNFNNVVFTDCQIVSPTDVSYFTTTRKILHLNGAVMTHDTLVIAATGPTAIVPAQPETVSVWPNPASQTVNIATQQPMNLVEVYNALGIKVKELNTNATNVQLPVGDLTNGTYLIKICHSCKTSTKHFVVKH